MNLRKETTIPNVSKTLDFKDPMLQLQGGLFGKYQDFLIRSVGTSMGATHKQNVQHHPPSGGD